VEYLKVSDLITKSRDDMKTALQTTFHVEL